MSLQTPPSSTPVLGRLSPRDQFLRASNMFDHLGVFKPFCSKIIWASIFEGSDS